MIKPRPSNCIAPVICIANSESEWLCICGNRADLDGFDPCTMDGKETDRNEAWAKTDHLHRCNNCGLIIAGRSGLVVGFAPNAAEPIGIRVVAALNKAGFKASWEYPGFVLVSAPVAGFHIRCKGDGSWLAFNPTPKLPGKFSMDRSEAITVNAATLSLWGAAYEAVPVPSEDWAFGANESEQSGQWNGNTLDAQPRVKILTVRWDEKDPEKIAQHIIAAIHPSDPRNQFTDSIFAAREHAGETRAHLRKAYTVSKGLECLVAYPLLERAARLQHDLDSVLSNILGQTPPLPRQEPR